MTTCAAGSGTTCGTWPTPTCAPSGATGTWSTLSPSATLEAFFKLLKNLYPDFAFKPEDIIQTPDQVFAEYTPHRRSPERGTIKSFARVVADVNPRRDKYEMKVGQLSTLRAYKRSPALSNSTWYKGILVSQMAGTTDNDGAFDLAISRMRRGTEPPPHVHSREHEFMYVLSGEIRFYVEGKVFTVTAGECMFLPRMKPHAFLLTSEEVQVVLFTTPGGFLDAINKMNAPADRMELPTDADSVTYASADLMETIKVFEQSGARFLTPEEIRAEMPEYQTSATNDN